MHELFSLERILEVFNIIFFFLLTNLLFVFFNLPLVLFLIFIGFSAIPTYLPLFLTCLIPLGPSLAAIFYCMHKFVVNKDCPSIRYFFKGYKSNFKESVVLGLLQLLFTFLLVCNIRIFTTTYPMLFLSIFFVILFCILILSIPYSYLLRIRFKMSTLEVIKASLTLVFIHPVLTVCNAIIFLFILMLFEISAGTTVLFMGSLYAFFILFSNKHLIKKLEDQAQA
ncbi:MAG: DUF624 domain-containing protein [Cellulosilyticaceae bacterium]